MKLISWWYHLNKAKSLNTSDFIHFSVHPQDSARLP